MRAPGSSAWTSSDSSDPGLIPAWVLCCSLPPEFPVYLSSCHSLIKRAEPCVVIFHVMNVSHRSELENLSNNAACDVIGLVTFVGRIERVKSKGNVGKKCSYYLFLN